METNQEETQEKDYEGDPGNTPVSGQHPDTHPDLPVHPRLRSSLCASIYKRLRVFNTTRGRWMATKLKDCRKPSNDITGEWIII